MKLQLRGFKRSTLLVCSSHFRIGAYG